jgi:hypothetical protein
MFGFSFSLSTLLYTHRQFSTVGHLEFWDVLYFRTFSAWGSLVLGDAWSRLASRLLELFMNPTTGIMFGRFLDDPVDRAAASVSLTWWQIRHTDLLERPQRRPTTAQPD